MLPLEGYWSSKIKLTAPVPHAPSHRHPAGQGWISAAKEISEAAFYRNDHLFATANGHRMVDNIRLYQAHGPKDLICM